MSPRRFPGPSELDFRLATRRFRRVVRTMVRQAAQIIELRQFAASIRRPPALAEISESLGGSKAAEVSIAHYPTEDFRFSMILRRTR